MALQVKIPTISSSDVASLRGEWFKTQKKSHRWHEGLDLVGYWEEGDSYVFKSHDGQDYVCISEPFLRDLLNTKKERSPMGPESDSEALIESLRNIRNDVTPMIEGMATWASTRPKSGAEVTLGLRKLQEARMWFGVAEAIEKGLDPWANQVEEKE